MRSEACRIVLADAARLAAATQEQVALTVEACVDDVAQLSVCNALGGLWQEGGGGQCYGMRVRARAAPTMLPKAVREQHCHRRAQGGVRSASCHGPGIAGSLDCPRGGMPAAEDGRAGVSAGIVTVTRRCVPVPAAKRGRHTHQRLHPASGRRARRRPSPRPSPVCPLSHRLGSGA
jgi:hypothetical protein